MAVVARMRVAKVEEFGQGRRVHLSAVYSSDPESPNFSFSAATPAANLDMWVSNPAAYEQFAEGKVFDLHFHENSE